MAFLYTSIYSRFPVSVFEIGVRVRVRVCVLNALLPLIAGCVQKAIRNGKEWGWEIPQEVL